MSTQYTLCILKAANGWVVSSFDPRNPGSVALDTMVVQDDNDLAGTIAAALVAQKLEGVSNDAPKKAQARKAGPYQGTAEIQF